VVHTADSLNRLTSQAIATAIDIHRVFGGGLLESAYLACLAHQLRADGLLIETQKPLALTYKGMRINCAYRADLVVEEAVLIEVKAVETLGAVHLRQLRTYLELADCRVGLLLNFGAPTMRAGIRRIVHRFPDDPRRVSAAPLTSA